MQGGLELAMRLQPVLFSYNATPGEQELVGRVLFSCGKAFQQLLAASKLCTYIDS